MKEPARLRKRPSQPKTLAAELCALEPPDGISLACDDFRLPNESYRHDAHRDTANHDDKSLLRFCNGSAKAASNPIKGKSSPRTRSFHWDPHARLAASRAPASHLT